MSAYICACILHADRQRQTDRQTDRHTYIHTYIHTCIRLVIDLITAVSMYLVPCGLCQSCRSLYHMYTHICIYIDTCTMLTYVNTYIHTYTHTYIHTSIHTYIRYIYIYIFMRVCIVSRINTIGPS